MNYEVSFRNEANHIYIPDWENREIAKMPEYVYHLQRTEGEFYYELEIGATWDDNFGELVVYKVPENVASGKEEVCVPLEEWEIQEILKYVEEVCFE